MKTLLLFRHAKSKKGAGLRDFDRPLNDRGRAAAELMGKTMRRRKIEPELILSSPALRARQTAEIAIASGRLKVELDFDERIYEASARRLLEVVSGIDERFNVAMMVGHNPGFEDLLALLTGEVHHLPTGSLSIIELEAEKWSDAGPRSGKIKSLLEPKKLRSENRS